MDRFIQDISGATAIEYSLVAALLAVTAIFAVTAFGESVVAMFQRIVDALPA